MKESISKKFVILDDIFPHPYSLNSWRGIEFFSYLDNFQDTMILSTLDSISLLGGYSKEEIIELYEENYPLYFEKFQCLEQKKTLDLENAGFVYSIFLNNIWNNMEYIEKYRIPFVFELYPGGGFALDNLESDQKLKKIMASECFKGVIVSSVVTYEYLLNKKMCEKSKINLIQGCIVNSWNRGEKTKKLTYGSQKETFDIAFAAYKYSEKGHDKGYDVFIAVAKELSKISKDFVFHVIGNFDEQTIDVTSLGKRIHFYGVREETWFEDFYKNVDVFLSPNRAFELNKGSFDGFPTGCAIDALLEEVVLIATDELRQNMGQYINGEDLFIVDNNITIIMDRILYLYNNPQKIYEIGHRGAVRAKYIYSKEKQILPRVEYLKNKMKEVGMENE